MSPVAFDELPAPTSVILDSVTVHIFGRDVGYQELLERAAVHVVQVNVYIAASVAATVASTGGEGRYELLSEPALADVRASIRMIGGDLAPDRVTDNEVANLDRLVEIRVPLAIGKRAAHDYQVIDAFTRGGQVQSGAILEDKSPFAHAGVEESTFRTVRLVDGVDLTASKRGRIREKHTGFTQQPVRGFHECFLACDAGASRVAELGRDELRIRAPGKSVAAFQEILGSAIILACLVVPRRIAVGLLHLCAVVVSAPRRMIPAPVGYREDHSEEE